MAKQPANGNGLALAEFATISSDKINLAGAKPLTVANKDGSYINVNFRSPDEVVYYLGEVLRAEMGHGDHPESITQVGEHVLFDAVRDDPSEAVVEIKHRGAKWSIPAKDPLAEDRSLEVISLLNQLIASQTTLKEFSRGSTTVRVRP